MVYGAGLCLWNWLLYGFWGSGFYNLRQQTHSFLLDQWWRRERSRIRLSTRALHGNWTPGATCFPIPGNAFFNLLNKNGNLLSLSILEVRKLRLKEVK